MFGVLLLVARVIVLIVSSDSDSSPQENELVLHSVG